MTGLLIDTEGTDCCCGPPPIIDNCLEFHQDPSVCPANAGVVNWSGVEIDVNGAIFNRDLINFGPYLALGSGRWQTPTVAPDCLNVGRLITSCPDCPQPEVHDRDIVLCGCGVSACVEFYFGQGIDWTTTEVKSLECTQSDPSQWVITCFGGAALSPAKNQQFQGCPGAEPWVVLSCGGAPDGCVNDGSFSLG